MTWPSNTHSVRREPSLGYLEISILTVGDGPGITSMVS